MKPIITERKARKKHKCDKCGAPITVGSVYKRITEKVGGKLVSTKQHLFCQTSLSAFRPQPSMPAMRVKKAEDLPQKAMSRMAIILYVVGTLAWDYTETILDITSQMKIAHTRRLSRAVRGLRQRYDAYRRRHLSQDDFDAEMRLAEMFELTCSPHFTKLSLGLKSKARSLDLADDYLPLFQAVYMALTVLDAMKLYANRCDAWIKAHGVFGHSILIDHFKSLRELVPLFIGDKYVTGIDIQTMTANILCNEMIQVEVCDESGETY